MVEIVEETITIPKIEYQMMLDEINWLTCLENAGVDNWEGYDLAREYYNEEFSNS